MHKENEKQAKRKKFKNDNEWKKKLVYSRTCVPSCQSVAELEFNYTYIEHRIEERINYFKKYFEKSFHHFLYYVSVYNVKGVYIVYYLYSLLFFVFIII